MTCCAHGSCLGRLQKSLESYFSPFQHKQVQKLLLYHSRSSISGNVDSFQLEEAFTGWKALTIVSSLMSGCCRAYAQEDKWKNLWLKPHNVSIASERLLENSTFQILCVVPPELLYSQLPTCFPIITQFPVMFLYLSQVFVTPLLSLMMTAAQCVETFEIKISLASVGCEHPEVLACLATQNYTTPKSKKFYLIFLSQKRVESKNKISEVCHFYTG